MKKKKIVVVGIMFLVFLFLIAGCFFVPRFISKAGNDEESKVIEGTVQRGDLQCSISATGTVSAGTDYEYFPVALTSITPLEVEKVYVKSGAEVTTKSAILKVTDESLKEASEDLSEQYADAKKELAQAKLQYKEDLLSLKSDYSSESVVAETAYESYKDTVEALSYDEEAAKVEWEESKKIISQYPEKIATLKKNKTSAKEKLKTLQEKQKEVTKDWKQIETAYTKQKQELEQTKENLEKIQIVKQYVDTYKEQNGSSDTEESQYTETQLDDFSKFVSNVELEEAAATKEYGEKETAYNKLKKEYEEKTKQKETLEENVSSQEDKIEKINTNLTNYEKELKEAKGNVKGQKAKYVKAVSARKTGTIQAEQEWKKNVLADDSASISYEQEKQILKDTLTEVEDAYKEAKDNWQKFKSSFSDGIWYTKESGTLQYIGYTEGDYLLEETPILGYNNDREFSMEITVDQSEIASIAVGDEVSAGQNFGNAITGKVTKITNNPNSTSASKVTYAVEVTFEDVNGSMESDTSVTVTFPGTTKKDVIYIAQRLVQEDSKGSYVTKKNADGTMERVDVTIGESNGTFVEIQDGLKEGDCCVIQKEQKEME